MMDLFAENVYQNYANRYVIRIIWAIIFITFVSFVCAMMGLFITKPITVFYNFILLIITNLICTLVTKKGFPLTKTRYILSTLFVLCAALEVYTYKNNYSSHFIWVVPLIISSLYNDSKLMRFTLVCSVVGMFTMDRFCPSYFPFTGKPSAFIDYQISLLITVACLIIVIYIVYMRSQYVKKDIIHSFQSVYQGVAIINHSLANEIMKMRLNIENMKDSTDEDEKHKGIDGIESSLEHLESMIGKLRKNILNADEINPEYLSLSEILDYCYNDYQPICEKNNIQLIKQYEPAIRVCADKLHIREVMNNLIKNAIEAVEHDGKIVIRAYNGVSHAYITVTDTGCGIKEEDLSHVANPWFSTKKDRLNNYGLGLTYCNGVIDAHKGEIHIESQVGKGTTIRINLPLYNAVDKGFMKKKKCNHNM